MDTLTTNDIYNQALEDLVTHVCVRKATFLVTGASGLIGSVIVDLLMLANTKGYECNVFALGRSKGKMQKKFSSYINNKLFHIISQDIRETIDDNLKFDYIIHGASNADPVSYARYPAETMMTTISGTYNILEYGRKHPNCRIVCLSTFEVYGCNHIDIYNEDAVGLLDFNVLRACYPESKRSAEVLAHSYFDEYKVNVSIARLSSVYGPTMSDTDSKAHAQFLHNAIMGENIVLKSKGEQKRSYTYVLDAVSGILTILFDGEPNHCYNISNEKSIATIAEVAQTIADISGNKVVFDVPTELEAKGFSKPQNCVLDNSKLKSLGWSGQYTLEKGLLECYLILKQKQ